MLKRLLCRHTNLEFYYNIYNKKIQEQYGGAKSIYICKNCGKMFFCNELIKKYNKNIEKNNTFKGKFIVIDGPDGIGKTTVIDKLKNTFKNKNFVFLNDPLSYGVPGEIRKILKNNKLSTESELLLFLVARKELNLIIQKYLKQGINVICDRYTLSTLVYQGRDISINKIYDYLMITDTHIIPSLLILLDREVPFKQSKDDELEKKYNNYSFIRYNYKKLLDSTIKNNGNKVKLFPNNIIIESENNIDNTLNNIYLAINNIDNIEI